VRARAIHRALGALAALGALLSLAGCTADPIQAVGLATNGRQNGMVAHWPFDGDSDGGVRDHSENGRDGVMTGGAIVSTGHFGDALQLATGDYVTVSNFPAETTASWTVAAWVLLPNATVSTLETVLSTEKVFEGGWELNIMPDPTTPQIEFAYWIGLPAGVTDPAYGYVRSTCACIVPGAWTHLVGVVDADQQSISVYENGVQRVTIAMPRTILPGNDFLYMGRWVTDLERPLTGALDDVVIYNRALDSDEIAELYRQPVSDP
jgi:hypothetical protein